MPLVSLIDVCKSYPGPHASEIVALHRLTLDLRHAEFLVVLGPSGSGKTTALRLIAGLESASAGDVRLEGRTADGLPPQDRGIAMVFQDHPLLAHLTVHEQLALPLRLQRLSTPDRDQRLRETIHLLHLEPLLPRLPHALSGGERQRVALATALIRRPRILLLDEPLAQLDAPARLRLRSELKRLQRALQLSALLVTHDQSEALALGDRLALLHQGTVRQIGTPHELYTAPADVFTARFLGGLPMNLIPGRLTSSPAGPRFLPAKGPPLPWKGPLPVPSPDPSTPLILGIRPEDLQPASELADLHAMVERTEFLGAESLVHLDWDRCPLLLTTRTSPPPIEGSGLGLALNWRRAHLFDESTGFRIACPTHSPSPN